LTIKKTDTILSGNRIIPVFECPVFIFTVCIQLTRNGPLKALAGQFTESSRQLIINDSFEKISFKKYFCFLDPITSMMHQEDVQSIIFSDKNRRRSKSSGAEVRYISLKPLARKERRRQQRLMTQVTFCYNKRHALFS
jgi:hypothetical protein